MSALGGQRLVAGICSAGEICVVDLEVRRRLGGAVYRGDTADIVMTVTPDLTRELPQIAGQAVLVALAQKTRGPDVAARAIITRPPERACGRRRRAPHPTRTCSRQPAPLPPIPVDLDQLVDLLHGGEHHSGGRLDVRTGEALPDLMFVS